MKASSRWKRFFRVLPLLLPLLASAQGGAAGAGKDRAFHWIDDEDYYPFISKNDRGEPVGIYYDIMTEIFRRLGVPLRVELYPWKRAQKLIADGEGDGMITALTRERSKLFLATEPIYNVSERAFARVDNPRIREILAIRDIRDLEGFRIVDTIGSGWAEEHLKDLDIVWAPSYRSAIHMLAKGRVDIYLLGKYPGMAALQKLIEEEGDPYNRDLKKIVPGPHQLAVVHYSLLIRKNSPHAALIPRIDRILDQMKKEGVYQAILDRYFSRIDRRLKERNQTSMEPRSGSSRS